MLRRSNRLNTSGYYNSDGEPGVSYKESGSTRHRRVRRRHTSGKNDISSFINTSQANLTTSHVDLTTSRVDLTNSRVDLTTGQVNMVSSKVNMATSNSTGFPIAHGLLWKLSLCLVFMSSFCMAGIFLGPGLSISPVPPMEPIAPPMEQIVPPMEPTAPPMEQIVPPMEQIVPPMEPTVPTIGPTTPPIESTAPPIESTVPPMEQIVPPMDPNMALNPSEEMEKRLREMTDELQRLNWRLNYRPPGDTMRNFALESQGARVLEDMSSKTYHNKRGFFIFGIPIYTTSKTSHNPSIVTEGKPIQVGRCWPFQGESGNLVIALSQPINISHVSVAHASKNMMLDGNITSALKTFAVYGMKTVEDEGTLLGTFFYDRNIESVQTFKLPDQDKGVFSIVKLKVMNNWGKPDYTCIYNFRVHGTQQEQTPHPG